MGEWAHNINLVYGLIEIFFYIDARPITKGDTYECTEELSGIFQNKQFY